MMTLDAADDSTQLVVREENHEVVIHGQIGQLDAWMLDVIDMCLVPVDDIPGLAEQEQKTGKPDPVLDMLRRLAMDEGYSPTDPRLNDVLEAQAEEIVQDMIALKNKSISYMAMLSMYLEKIEKNALYMFVDGCKNVRDFCLYHINMSKNFYQEVEQIGEYCRLLRKAGLSMFEIFTINLDKVTHSFIKGLGIKLETKLDEEILQEAQIAYPEVFEEAQYELERNPPQLARGREGQQEQAVLAQTVLAKLPEPERKVLSDTAWNATQDYAKTRINEIVKPGPSGVLANHAESKGEPPKEKARIVYKCTYDPVTGEFNVTGLVYKTIILHHHGLMAARGLIDERYVINDDTREMKLSELGEYITECTLPSKDAPTPALAYAPSHDF